MEELMPVEKALDFLKKTEFLYDSDCEDDLPRSSRSKTNEDSTNHSSRVVKVEVNDSEESSFEEIGSEPESAVNNKFASMKSVKEETPEIKMEVYEEAVKQETVDLLEDCFGTEEKLFASNYEQQNEDSINHVVKEEMCNSEEASFEVKKGELDPVLQSNFSCAKPIKKESTDMEIEVHDEEIKHESLDLFQDCFDSECTQFATNSVAPNET